jgi:hypothetical protein
MRPDIRGLTRQLARGCTKLQVRTERNSSAGGLATSKSNTAFIRVKVKVKIALEQTTKALKGSRSIPLLFL